VLTKLIVKNVKRFEHVEIELGNPVVFVGPNNSGKTIALQALALWDIGLKRWNERRAGKAAPEKVEIPWWRLDSWAAYAAAVWVSMRCKAAITIGNSR
jgi:predicted ATPase